MKFFKRFFILLCFSVFWIFYLKAKMQYIKESLFAMQRLILNFVFQKSTGVRQGRRKTCKQKNANSSLNFLKFKKTVCV